MPRPRKPQWMKAQPGRPGRFRTKIDGKAHYFPPTIGQHDKPQYLGIPVAAWDYLRQLEHREYGRASAGTDPTVYWLCQLYLEWADQQAQGGAITVEQYKGQASRLRLFLAHPGVPDARARHLTVDTLDEFFATLRPKYSDHYVAGVGRTIRAVFRWGAKAIPKRTPTRLLAENPLAGYDFPRPPGAVRGYLEGQIVRAWLRWCWARARAQPGLYRRFDRLFVLMLWFQRLTGCRPGEACRLLWSDIDWQAGKIVIPAERHKTGKKTKRDRIIHLTPPVVRLLRTIERLPDHHPEHVFTHRRGNNAVERGHLTAEGGEPWPNGSAASAKVREWREEAIEAAKRMKAAGEPTGGLEGIEATGPRKLVAYLHRHGYVSEAVSKGLSHEQTANLVGNTAAVVASTYAHAIEQADAERARKLMERGKRD